MLLRVADMDTTSSLDPLLGNSELSLSRSTSHQLHLNSASNGERTMSGLLAESSPSLLSGVSYRTSTTSLEADPRDCVLREGAGNRGECGAERSHIVHGHSTGECGAERSHIVHGHSTGSVNSDDMCCPQNCGVCSGKRLLTDRNTL